MAKKANRPSPARSEDLPLDDVFLVKLIFLHLSILMFKSKSRAIQRLPNCPRLTYVERVEPMKGS